MVMAFWPASDGAIRSGFAPAYVAGWCLWLIATLVLSIQATGLIGVERSHQSLDVLLTTPIESDEIVRQKFAGVWRMIHVLWVPFATLYVFQAWWETWIGLANSPYWQGSPEISTMFTVLRAVLAVSLYLPTIAWFGFYQGLRCRSQTHAILLTMTVITLACVAPPLLSWILTPSYPPSYQYGPPTIPLISWLSPAVVLSAQPWDPTSWFLLVVHFGGVAVLYLWLAAVAKRSFARRVGRNDGILNDDREWPVAPLSVEARLALLRRGGVGTGRHDERDPSGKI